LLRRIGTPYVPAMQIRSPQAVRNPRVSGGADLAHRLVSVVLPVFNERENLPPLVREITAVLQDLDHEVVAVDDGSTDDSLSVLQGLQRRYPQLRVVSRPRRGGQSAALLDGFRKARGDVVVTLDADGQNDPEDIPHLLDILGEGRHRAVVGYRARRAAGIWKRTQARVANAIRDVITGDSVRDTGCALRVVRREDLLALPRFAGLHRFIPTLLRRAGVRIVEVPVRDRPRLHGRSKYGMWNRVFVGVIDALGVRWLKMRRIH